jgi:hypothetical protein
MNAFSAQGASNFAVRREHLPHNRVLWQDKK